MYVLTVLEWYRVRWWIETHLERDTEFHTDNKWSVQYERCG